MSGTTGTASTAIVLSPAEEKKADKDRLVTALVNVCGAPHARCKDHPIMLALKHDGIALLRADLIHMTAADIGALQCVKGGALAASTEAKARATRAPAPIRQRLLPRRNHS